MLNKKELKSCESPEPETGPYDQIPNKFPKMTNSEFDQLLKNQPLPDNTTNLVSLFIISINRLLWSLL